jgi:hypothetical protein
MDPKGKGMMINDKEKETLYVNEPKDDKPTDSGSSHKMWDGNKKRRIKKIIYYDSDASSSSPSDDNDEDSSSKKKTVNQNYSFDYYRIPYNLNAHLLSIPLGKPPHFDGEDYSFWSHKMHSHLFFLHPSIWEIVENGMHFDSTDNTVFINEQIHKNAQATSVLLASLCRCNTPSNPWTGGTYSCSSLGSYIVPTGQPKSFVRTLSSLMRTRENFPVGHTSQIAPSQARLTWRLFRDRLPKKKMHLVDMITLLIVLSLGPGYPIPRARISQSTPLRRLTSSSVNPNPGTSPLSHVYVSSVVICHAM